MAVVNDDMKEDSVPSSLLNSIISNLYDETLSPEDVAWADSCLIKDVDASDGDWSSIKDALFEILSLQAEPTVNSSVAETSMELTADETFHFIKNTESGRGSDEDEDLIDEDDDFEDIESIDISEDDEDDFVFKKKRGRVRGKKLNVFRPNYSEDIKAENLDSDLSSSLPTYEVNTSMESIFQVWDLGISDEQDDFTKQLNKALTDGLPQNQTIPSDSAVLKDRTHVSIDDLIAGIGDLSLKQNT